MIVGSTKEDLSLEKRISITPETAKNIINLGLKICIENDYATHIGIQDEFGTINFNFTLVILIIPNILHRRQSFNQPSFFNIHFIWLYKHLIGIIKSTKFNCIHPNNIICRKILPIFWSWANKIYDYIIIFFQSIYKQGLKDS